MTHEFDVACAASNPTTCWTSSIVRDVDVGTELYPAQQSQQCSAFSKRACMEVGIWGPTIASNTCHWNSKRPRYTYDTNPLIFMSNECTENAGAQPWLGYTSSLKVGVVMGCRGDGDCTVSRSSNVKVSGYRSESR